MRNFVVTSKHDIFVDHFENGEGNFVNSFELKSEHKTEKWQDAIDTHFRFFGINCEVGKCEIVDNTLQTSYLVDEENDEPSANDLQLWMEGKTKLFADNVTLTISEIVNVELV